MRRLMLLICAVGCADKTCPPGFEMNEDGLCLQLGDTASPAGPTDTDTDADTDTDTDTDTEPTGPDADGDGFDSPADCDDSDPAVHPDAEELCGNGIDDNCNGLPDGCDWTGSYTVDAPFIEGTYADGRLGASTVSCDADGDGSVDLVVSAYKAAVGANDSGAVFVFYGPLLADSLSDLDADVVFAPTTVDQQAQQLACGDANDDGLDEVLVGAPGHVDPGEVYLLSASTPGSQHEADALAIWSGENHEDELGYDVGMLDTDGDGIQEIAAISRSGTSDSSTENGVAYVMSGSSTGELDPGSALARIYGQHANTLSDFVGSAGDLDGDGDDELLVGGQPGPAGTGRSLFRGPLSGVLVKSDHDLNIDQGHDGYDLSPLAPADLDGDGRDDLVVDNRHAMDAAGMLHIWTSDLSSDTSTLLADATLVGTEGAALGKSYASLGDVNDDGAADLAVGGWVASQWAYSGGAVSLLYGPFVGTLEVATHAQARWEHTVDYTSMGASMTAADIDEDQVLDLLVGGSGDEGLVMRLPVFEL